MNDALVTVGDFGPGLQVFFPLPQYLPCQQATDFPGHEIPQPPTVQTYSRVLLFGGELISRTITECTQTPKLSEKGIRPDLAGSRVP